jgi:hypothetical protein
VVRRIDPFPELDAEALDLAFPDLSDLWPW